MCSLGSCEIAARVAAFDEGRLVVESQIGASVGDSVAVDGVCLTDVDARQTPPPSTSELVDDDVARDRLIPVQEQKCQHRLLPRAAERDPSLAVVPIERPEDAVVRCGARTYTVGRLITARWAAMGAPWRPHYRRAG